MAHSQSWTLSKEANKLSGTCCHCFAVRQLHLKDGTVHLHGPRNNPCPGSRKLPTGHPQPQSQSTTHHSQSLPPNLPQLPSNTAPSLSPPQPPVTPLLPLPTAITFNHLSATCPIITHTPKSARPA